MELIKIKRNDLQRGYEMKEVDNHDDKNSFFLYLMTMNQSFMTFMYYGDSCTAG